MQILIADFGSQYTLLIGRMLREIGVRSIILPPQKVSAWLKENRPKGIILSGGAASIYEDDAPNLPDGVLNDDIPILGICYGMHWLAQRLGGRVEPRFAEREYGAAEMILCEPDPLFHGLTDDAKFTVWMSHGDSVTAIPANFKVIGRTAGNTAAAISWPERRVWGLQFHPEVNHTIRGRAILENFLEVCSVKHDWRPDDVITRILQEVAAAVGPDENCILAFSGGVDSSTLTAIVAPVLGSRLTCITLDHGGLRAGEADEVKENALAAGCWYSREPAGRPSFDIFGRWKTFLNAIVAAGTDAEAKRRAFREQYQIDLETLAAEADARVLIQGTLAPDVIESGRVGGAATIKTHHNVGMETWLRQIHPLAGLFKYEVRDLARYLKLPPSITERKPFPGPGFYCRIVGVPVTAELLELVRWADAEVRRITAEEDLEQEFAQLVVGLIGVRTVGVKGDGRSYGYAIAVRAVQTSDFMTCRGYQFPPEVRRSIQRAVTKHPEITRVWFDENDKPPATVEFE